MSEQPSSEFRSFVMDGETCEITMEESGQLVAYRVHSTCVALFFERKGLVPSQVVASGQVKSVQYKPGP
jgi:hypothetical protein